MGTKLYGNPEIALRELLQNSIDAFLLRQAQEKKWGNLYEPEITVKYYTEGKDEILEVIDHHIANAVTCVYPNVKIDYPKLKFSNVKCTIDTVMDPGTTVLPGNVLKVKWETLRAPNKNTKETDLLVILFYSPELNRYMSSTDGFSRSDLEMEMQMSKIFIGKKVHGYLFFISENGKFTSDTEYLTPIA